MQPPAEPTSGVGPLFRPRGRTKSNPFLQLSACKSESNGHVNLLVDSRLASPPPESAHGNLIENFAPGALGHAHVCNAAMRIEFQENVAAAGQFGASRFVRVGGVRRRDHIRIINREKPALRDTQRQRAISPAHDEVCGPDRVSPASLCATAPEHGCLRDDAEEGKNDEDDGRARVWQVKAARNQTRAFDG